MKITQSFIFAAGRGERMRPITDSIPKPLVKVAGKSIIDYTIEKLNRISVIQKIIINGFYLADQIEAHIKALNNPKIIFSREEEKIETGGGLLFARDKLDESQPVLLINGDILWQESSDISDIELLCNAYNPNDCDVILGLKKTGEFFGYEGNGDFNFDQKTGEVFVLQNKMKLESEQILKSLDKYLSHVFVGLQVVNPKILNAAPAKCFSMNYFYKQAAAINGKLTKIKGVELKGKYFHIGDVKSFDEVQKFF